MYYNSFLIKSNSLQKLEKNIYKYLLQFLTFYPTFAISSKTEDIVLFSVQKYRKSLNNTKLNTKNNVQSKQFLLSAKKSTFQSVFGILSNTCTVCYLILFKSECQ